MSINKSSYDSIKSYFPYNPYIPQEDYMKDVFSLVENGKIGLLEAPSGFGKTSALLTSTVGFPNRIYYYSRTHAQMKQVSEELERINKKSGAGFSCVVRGSRNQLCIDNELHSIKDNANLTEVCFSRIKNLKKNKDPFDEIYSKSNNSLFDLEYIPPEMSLYCKTKMGMIKIPSTIPKDVPLLANVENLLQYGLKNNVCPYFLAKLLAQSYKVVVGSYKYLFYDNFYQDQIVILDEAHNIEQLCKDGFTFNLSQSTVKQALDELKEIDRPWASELEELFINLLMFFNNTEFKNEEFLSSSQLLTELDKYGVILEKIKQFLDDWHIILNCWNELKIIRNRFILLTNLKIIWVYTFFENFVYSADKYYKGIWSLENTKNPTLIWFCLDSQLAFNYIRKRNPKTIILTSGTLSPQEGVANRLGIKESFIKSYPSVIPDENIQLLAISKGITGNILTTAFIKREDQEIIIDYGKTIVFLINNIPNGTVVFFPSYPLMNKMLELWQKQGILDHLYASLFIELKKSKSNIIDLYFEEASKNKAALFAVMRGKLSEGQNFPDEKGRAVIIVGIPYPNTKDAKLIAQKEYYEKKGHGMGNQWYFDQTFFTVNQALGRGWRHKNDYAIGILLDSRYSTKLNTLPFWLAKKTMLIEPHTPYSTIEKIIQNFFKGRK